MLSCIYPLGCVAPMLSDARVLQPLRLQVPRSSRVVVSVATRRAAMTVTRAGLRHQHMPSEQFDCFLRQDCGHTAHAKESSDVAPWLAYRTQTLATTRALSSSSKIAFLVGISFPAHASLPLATLDGAERCLGSAEEASSIRIGVLPGHPLRAINQSVSVSLGSLSCTIARPPVSVPPITNYHPPALCPSAGSALALGVCQLSPKPSPGPLVQLFVPPIRSRFRRPLRQHNLLPTPYVCIARTSIVEARARLHRRSRRSVWPQSCWCQPGVWSSIPQLALGFRSPSFGTCLTPGCLETSSREFRGWHLPSLFERCSIDPRR